MPISRAFLYRTAEGKDRRSVRRHEDNPKQSVRAWIGCQSNRRPFAAGNPDARIFGVTATPNRGDKKGLREVFDNVADQVRLRIGTLDPVELSRIGNPFEGAATAAGAAAADAFSAALSRTYLEPPDLGLGAMAAVRVFAAEKRLARVAALSSDLDPVCTGGEFGDGGHFRALYVQ
ncbi:hypothetical protein RNZ50_14755 [Paracoccaceae bacterium Fryx2]|nr:hypothetical protein [Paracoccaceae bacterium Fryx2]